MTLDTPIAPTDSPGAATSHPLDPLSGPEIERAAALTKADPRSTETLKFVMISLEEPAKPATLEFDPTDYPDRKAFVVAYDAAAKLITEVIVNLATGEVEGWTPVPGRFPSYLSDAMMGVELKVKEDERWQEAMRKRGVEDFDLVMVDPWPAGYMGPQDAFENSPTICRPLSFVRSAPGEHGYARPVEGVIVTYDMDAEKVIDVVDHGVVPLPPKSGNYSEHHGMFDPDNRPAFEGFRTDVKDIVITQPDGPSYTVDGYGVTWQKWAFRVAFNPREGLVLHTITYNDKGVERPIMYRAALSEMVVPYGDVAPTHWNKNVFDMGEVGMGMSANPLTLGCDCLGEIFYFDGIVNNSAGEAVTIPNAVCMHEEDFGIAWKHTDFRTEEVEVRRSRRLVISMICTVGNYEYGFFWYLYTDGSIEYEVKLSGVLTTGSWADEEKPKYGNLVAPGIYGPHHQHFFNVRMDMAIDGPNNTVYEIDSLVESADENPYNNAWYTQATPITSERDGARDWKWETNRYWKIASDKVNELGEKTAYKLEPRAVVAPFVQKGSYIYDRARFVQKPVWVTAYDPEEMYAAGDYMAQSADMQGLPVYLEDDAPLENTDVVLWYTLGTHHIVRPEDWPVMPVAYIGFHLKPVGFFDGNPALDLPPSTPAGGHCSMHHGHGAPIA
ncbi:primary-amine oxidase [Nocardioides sp. Kera G14]|uniref:primary-amine oxidase n=1 Tax=Nocardioides sp. Kera G14 TaxID=2884264 RepID=UPI001D12359D|nr:primary-amine oxidase [Nocardioides sp. Kera G14]UDY24805.1 primary-amine oxidase [Nocardioides sp. Kera G14]